MLFVDPAVTRRGVATALLEHVTRIARGHGAVELTTYASLTARPFFEARVRRGGGTSSRAPRGLADELRHAARTSLTIRPCITGPGGGLFR
ncbi:GNAT family N-acetyltransferase [Oerskovia sp. M15]